MIRVKPSTGYLAAPSQVHSPHRIPTRLSTDTIAAVPKSAALTARQTCPSVPVSIHCHMLRKTKAMDYQ